MSAVTRANNGISVILANYNFSRFLDEAVRSVLEQTVKPDEFIIIDDASADGSQKIMRKYAEFATLIFNETNLGTVENFKKAISQSSGEFIVILDGDNRMRRDFLEKSLAAFASDPGAAVAYTDMLIFGPEAESYAKTYAGTRRAGSLIEDRSRVFIREFPDPTPETLAAFRQRENFIHGNSMYRRVDYERTGGYRETTWPEDFDLFRRMVTPERRAVHVRAPILEYRQHSTVQRNYSFCPIQREKAAAQAAGPEERLALLTAERDALQKAVELLTKQNQELKKDLTSRERRIVALQRGIEDLKRRLE